MIPLPVLLQSLVKPVLWFFAVILSVVLTIIFQDRVHWLLIKIFGKRVPHRRRVVTGIWFTIYFYKSKDRRITERHLFLFRQFGTQVIGFDLNGKNHKYQIRGSLEQEMYLTGLWRNIVDRDLYHGACQFVLNPKGDKMKGKWVGFDSNHEIQHGDWKWQLISQSTDRKSIRNAFTTFENILNPPAHNPAPNSDPTATVC